MNEKNSLQRAPTDRVIIGALILATLWFCRDLIFHGEVPFFRDLGTYFYPLRLSLAESFKNGELPIWDRRFAQGFPMLAAFQPGVFYPPHLVLGLVPFFLGIRLLFVFHFVIAATGAFKLIQNWRHSNLVAVTGAMMFALGGTLVSLSNLLNHFQSAVWLPWILWSWEKLSHAPDWRRFLLFTGLSALQFLAGSPEFFGLSIVLVLINAIRIWRQPSKRSVTLLAGLLAGAVLLLIAICMVQILPTSELFLHSRRQLSIPGTEAVSWSFDPFNLVNLFFPDREVDLGSPAGVQYLIESKSPFFVTGYLGVVWLFGVLAYFYSFPWRHKLAATCFIAVSLLLSLGSHTPVYPFLLDHLPFLSAFRFPEKFFFLTYTGILFVSIKGLGGILDDEAALTKPTALLLACNVSFWFVMYGAAYLASESLASPAGFLPPLRGDHLASLLANLERQVLLAGAISLVIFLFKTRKLRLSLATLLLAGIVFADLASVNRGFLFSMRPEEIVKSAEQNIHRSNGWTRTFYYPSSDSLHPSSVFVRGRPSYPEFVAVWFRDLLPNAGVFYGIEYLQEIDALGRQPYTAFLTFADAIEPSAQIRLLRAFNVEYIVAFRELSVHGLLALKHAPKYYAWLYRVEHPMPRAYIVNKSRVEKNAMRTLSLLAGESFHPETEVLVDRELGVHSVRSLEAKTRIVNYKNTLVSLETETNDDGLLVLLDSYYPGWKAYVDGRETAIARANHFYRAVPVSKGKHLVEFKYEPLSFKIGAIISSVTLFLIVIISLILFIRKVKFSQKLGSVD